MSGLMLVFMFIAIGFMIEVESEKEKMKDVTSSYRDTKADLNEVLYSEFEEDLVVWDASITKDNSIVFHSPKVLFKVSKSDINEEFKTILDEFFPRYIKILTSSKFQDEIKEVRVEGHTSNSWGVLNSRKEIYLKNMLLSQARAYEVLAYCYSLNDTTVNENRNWLEQNFRANGMAFSKLKEQDKARRVEFTIQMKSEDKIFEILKMDGEG